jgi:hypothetical protein
MPQIVVDLRWVNFAPLELENNLYINFKFLRPESLIHWDTILMNSHILFRTNVEKAAGHDIMFLFQIGKYL